MGRAARGEPERAAVELVGSENVVAPASLQPGGTLTEVGLAPQSLRGMRSSLFRGILEA